MINNWPHDEKVHLTILKDKVIDLDVRINDLRRISASTTHDTNQNSQSIEDIRKNLDTHVKETKQQFQIITSTMNLQHSTSNAKLDGLINSLQGVSDGIKKQSEDIQGWMDLERAAKGFWKFSGWIKIGFKTIAEWSLFFAVLFGVYQVASKWFFSLL